MIFHSTKNLHTFTREDYTYGKLLEFGLSFGYQVHQYYDSEQIFPVFYENKPNIVIIDSHLEQTEIEKILKCLFYSHCPYGVLFLGEHSLLTQPIYGMREIMNELNILGKIDYPVQTEAMMEKVNQVESDSYFLTSDMIKNGLKNNEFELYYQPMINLSDKHIEGAEALIRWHHPSLGLTGPDRFLPIAEKTNVIDELTLWTFESGIKQLLSWQKKGFSLKLAMNISEKILKNQKIFSSLEKLCQQFKINCESISLEISELSFKKEIEVINSIVQYLYKLGFQITIDDLELKYLNIFDLLNLGINSVKINRIHILDLDKNPFSVKIAKSVIDIAHNFDFKIGAAGIESIEILELLKSYGCNYGQGYHFCKPIANNAFNAWVKNNGSVMPAKAGTQSN